MQLMISHRDILVSRTPQRDLFLDLHLPDPDDRPAPLVVWVHGGGWKMHDRTVFRMPWLPTHGYAVACIEYRWSQEAVFPAQIHDCKAGIRAARALADVHGYDASRIVIAGGSAGGMLAMLCGLTNGSAAHEGDLGHHREVASTVDGIISYYGAFDFALRRRDNPARHLEPGGSSYALLDGERLGHPDPALEALADPIRHMHDQAPPILLFHGRADTSVLAGHSEQVEACYARAQRPCEAHYLDDGVHTDARLFQGTFKTAALAWLDRFFAS